MSRRFLSLLTFFCFLFCSPVALISKSADATSDLLCDLLTVDEINQRIYYRLPVFHNHLLYGGYFNIPSARMGREGEIGAGYSYVPPYRNYNICTQVTDFLELSINYRIFKNEKDLNLSQYGFGDKSDKGANLKVSLFHPEDSQFQLPGFAFGWEDFLGTKVFLGYYGVFTQVLPKYQLELSIGYGGKRLKGFFGGISWLPFGCCKNWFKDLALAAEYDPVRYESDKIEPHPKGRKKKSSINWGLKYRLCDQWDFSLSQIRGMKLAFSFSTFYNFGMSEGILPKIHNPPLFSTSKGLSRLEDIALNQLLDELVSSFKEQGFSLLETSLSYDSFCRKILTLRVTNNCYRQERKVRSRLNKLISGLVPEDIFLTVVKVEGEGFTLHEYHFPGQFVKMYKEKQLSCYELKVLSPLSEISSLKLGQKRTFFYAPCPWWNVELLPRLRTIFGSAKGKFKYSLGLNLLWKGYLYDDLFYSLVFGYTFFSSLYDV